MKTPPLRGIALAGLMLTASSNGWCDSQTLMEKVDALIACFQRISQPVPPAEDVLARVGQSVVTPAEFIERFRGVPPAYKADAALPKGRQQMLQNLISQKATVELARAAGVENDPDYRKEFTLFEERELSRFYQKRLAAAVTVSRAEAQAYYQAHPAEFTEGPVYASHIVTKTYGDVERAQKLILGGKPFEAVAKAMSTDRATAVRGGKMQPIPFSKTDPVFQTVFRTLKKGMVSGIVQTALGFELIRKDQELKGSLTPFAAVEKDIQSKLQSQKINKQIAEAKATLAITMDEKKLQSLSLPTE